jgi:hypothetical protein
MVVTQRTLVATWLTALGFFTATLAATLWKRAIYEKKVRAADEKDLIRLDSDMG